MQSSSLPAPPVRRALLLAGVALGASVALPAAAQTASPTTAAGTAITNTATATYATPTGPSTPVRSNEVTLLVSELLAVDVVSADTANVPTTPGATTTVLTFDVTNIGNGPEAFTLTTGQPTSDDFDAPVTAIWIDNGDGSFDPTTDTRYDPATGLALDAGEAARIFLVTTTPATATDTQTGDVTLTAVARTITGSDNPGTVYAGAGENSSDAIVGPTRGRDTDEGTLIVQAAVLRLAKTAVVAGGDYDGQPFPGATITYTITATAEGSGSLTGVTISDAVPAGTTYVPGSITLQGNGLTDAAGDDAGEIATDELTVRTGTIPSNASRSVTFQVTID